MRLLFHKSIPANTPERLFNAAAVNNLTQVGTTIRTMPGVGEPFLVVASLPAAPTAVLFDLYPQYVVSNDVAENVAMMQEMLANPPLDALIY